MADKILKSLNFGGADRYFPLPLVTAADNDKILSVVNGEWAAAEAPSGGGGSGSYVWTKQGMSETFTEDTTGGKYTLTTSNTSRPSSEIEMCTAAPVYDSSKRQWNFDSTSNGYMKGTVSNEDSVLPPIGVGPWPSEIYVRVTSEPNIWYLVTEFGVGNSSPYSKDMTYSKKFTSDIDWAKKYLTNPDGDAYLVDGWALDGYYYRRVISDPNRTEGVDVWNNSNINTKDFSSIYYANGIWVAGTGYYNSGGIYYSTDSKTWTQSNITSGPFQSVYYANGIWVAASHYDYGNGGKGLYYSTDGKTWTQSNITDIGITDVYYSNRIWVACSSNSTSCLYYSTDGKTWTQSNITGSAFSSVYYANGIWVAGSISSKGLYYSTDGKTWAQSNITNINIKSIYYGNGIWVAGSGNGLYYSTDGKTWTQSNINYNQISSVYYANGIWVAGSGNGLYYSTDGMTWVKSNITSTTIYTVYYVNGIWVAGVNYYSDPNKCGLYYSTDGKTWAQSNITNINIKSIYYDNGIWVAGSDNNKGLVYSETISIEVDF